MFKGKGKGGSLHSCIDATAFSHDFTHTTMGSIQARARGRSLLSFTDIHALPHRYPFILLDRERQ